MRTPKPGLRPALNGKLLLAAGVLASFLVGLLLGMGWGQDLEGGVGGGVGGIGGGVLRQGRRLCTFASSQAPWDPFAHAIAIDGWPTRYEQWVANNQTIANVHCPICGATHQTIAFKSRNFR